VGNPASGDRSPVALVHDYLLVMRGAERTFAAIADRWPNAPIYTLLYDREGTLGRFEGRVVRTSYLQRARIGQGDFRKLLPLLPGAARSLQFGDHRLVISSSSAFAHTVDVGAAEHVCYCHSPFRYAWFESGRALAEVSPIARPLLKLALRRVRRSDRKAARQVDRYVANSAITRRRLLQFWGRDSVVIHPPVAVERFSLAEPEDYFLIVAELVRHKRVEFALEAADRAGARVKVVGAGPDRPRLEERFGGPNGVADFLGRVEDEELAGLYSHARAFLLPNVEEFGIAAVEAQAAGRPVIAIGRGGALETVIEGETGLMVEPDDLDAFSAALRDPLLDHCDPRRIAAHARNFSVAAFQRRLDAVVNAAA
jgi:glycosyltransferase involved in cell wall biosynthesis